MAVRYLSLTVGLIGMLIGGSASAQSVSLTGTYQCVQKCRDDMLAYVTQNGPTLNLLTEAGVPSRAWPDWFAPATRIWVDIYDSGAVYTPDGVTIQFDNGTIWQRYTPPPVPLRRRG
ncbi:hypothetical protein [Bradyrhizobium guangdongense]|uniref:hypothetical protein n=1 Tax=Bradyrhizobium guangdongense TaxID=1325090 RepID=UPI0016434D56|nr:hypothetical protein [Bradyrhizobium guangdongense]